ncbi:uncharacterized protein LOC106129860 isoform X1 [Amyelois transitella]|uniref:uncharacterized protein LOC106129860 isoform X1 n=1 Tax=Amyelois transitella TaxID=680683 RepID=UPI00298F9675|nr:uncharacterized protein LOC106129860 isoform X1 [Amyelois transitella]
MDRNMIKKQRQDNLEMCRMFSENKALYGGRRANSLSGTPYYEKEQILRRGKRSADYKSNAGEQEDARRVESIVDRLYDDMDGNGGRVEYRRRNLDPPITITTTVEVPLNQSGRRFPFAPAILLDPEDAGPGSKTPDLNVKTVEVPWHKKWINGIVPFFIDPNTYDSTLALKITKAFDYFERATCIRLQRLKDKPTDKKSLKEVEWLYITNPLGIRQCVHSNAVKVNKGVQMVVFGYDCLSLGEIVHEVMHILGFSHEHARPDRDQHITVLWNNIKPGYKHYFDIKSIGTLVNLPYDYSSILHYPPKAFSRNGQYTILADKNVGSKLGQRKGLSELDIEKVTMIYGNECVDRNRKYLLQTCPSVVKPAPTNKQQMTKNDIEDYFKDRLWPYGVVTYKIRDDVEFSAEELENIKAVFRHIQKETCIEFQDSNQSNEAEGNDKFNDDNNKKVEDDQNKNDQTEGAKNENVQNEGYKNENIKSGDNNPEINKNEDDNNVGNNEVDLIANEMITVSTNSLNETRQKLVGKGVNGYMPINAISRKSGEDKTIPERRNLNTEFNRKTGRGKSEVKLKRVRRSVKGFKSGRRHADNILILTRSTEPGCKCPEPGKQEGIREIKINADCFNSVNDLLHLFVHILGLDHQHNMHDRDEYLKIDWDNLTPDMKEELQNKLPPAASVGFPYDYLSVMHYPWLQIKDGVANIMYPVWNDGWAMGHWQGLSSTDVQKLNLLYFQQCVQRKNLQRES